MRNAAALAAFLLLAALFPPSARAAPPPIALRLVYTAYADGLATVQMAAALELTPRGYGLSFDYHTVGVVGFLFPGHDLAEAAGTWRGDAAEPRIFESRGSWNGRQYDVVIGYAGGVPEVRRLVPSEADRREPVPAPLQQATIDTVSAMALLLQRVIEDGSCRLAVRVFDGRRLVALQAEPAGTDRLGVTARSFFHGPALRCDLRGRLLAGFLRSDGPAMRRRVNHGVVWFAHPVPGLPLLPVRIAFSTGWFGAAMMYLTNIAAGPRGAALTQPSRLARRSTQPVSQEDKASH